MLLAYFALITLTLLSLYFAVQALKPPTPVKLVIASKSEPVIAVKPLKRDDSKLKRVSISTNNVLFDSNFDLIPSMAKLLPILSSKYRVFLITQIQSEDAPEYKKAKLLLESLTVAEHQTVQSHRVMWCSTAKGKESMIRQLSAELHIESDVALCQSL